MKQFIVETSARHVHVTQQDLETLFGKGYELTVKKMLSQPGQYACAERVDVVGEKKTLTGVSILGPCRKETQVELSLTDARSIGVKAPIRESGDLEGSGACKLVGPKGEVVLEKGVIAAKRHIHMTPADAEAFMAAGADIILLPAPGTVPGITQEYAHRLIEVVHSRGKLALTAIGTSQEGADTDTIRRIALMCKMAGTDIHHIGDTGYTGMALAENIMAYSIAVRGIRHTYHRMAISVER